MARHALRLIPRAAQVNHFEVAAIRRGEAVQDEVQDIMGVVGTLDLERLAFPDGDDKLRWVLRILPLPRTPRIIGDDDIPPDHTPTESTYWIDTVGPVRYLGKIEQHIDMFLDDIRDNMSIHINRDVPDRARGG